MAPSQYFIKEQHIFCPTGTISQSGYSWFHSIVHRTGGKGLAATIKHP